MPVHCRAPTMAEEIAARASAVADTREQCPLIRERNMNQGVEGHHGVCAGRPQMQASHIGLNEAGCGHKAPCPLQLDYGEINPEHLQPVFGQLTGGRYPGPAAEVDHPGTGPQQAGQFRRPQPAKRDILGGGTRRIAVTPR